MDGFPYGFMLVFLRAPLPVVCEQLSRYFDTPVGKPLCGIESLIFQFERSEWTGFLFEPRLRNDAYDISATLGVTEVILEHDDTSGWTIYQLVERGEVVEEFTFGLVESGEARLPEGWDAMALDPKSMQLCLFRSRLRRETEMDLRDEQVFLDKTFRSQRLWCPGWQTISQLPKLSGVHCLEKTIYS